MISIHGGKKRNKPEQDDKTLGNADEFKMHICRVHEGKKTSKCEHCDKTYARTFGIRKQTKTVSENDKDIEFSEPSEEFLHSETIDIKEEPI